MKIRLEGRNDPENIVYVNPAKIMQQEKGSVLAELAEMNLEYGDEGEPIELPADRFDIDDIKILRLYLNKQITFQPNTIAIFGRVSLTDDRIREGLIKLSEFIISSDPVFLENANIVRKNAKHMKTAKRVLSVRERKLRRDRLLEEAGIDENNKKNEKNNNNNYENEDDPYLARIPMSAIRQYQSTRQFHTRKQKAKAKSKSKPQPYKQKIEKSRRDSV